MEQGDSNVARFLTGAASMSVSPGMFSLAEQWHPVI